MFPPHLPPQSCNIASHRRWQRLKFVFAFTIFGLIVGMSGASMMLGWIWPRFADGDTWINSYNRPALSRIQLEDRVRQEISSRIVSVYQGESNLNGVNYLKQKIGDAIVVSSDGWIAMYKPDFDGNFKSLAILAQDNSVYQLENALQDRYSDVLYLKIKGGQFEVVNFSDALSISDDVFIYNNSYWERTLPQYAVFGASSIPHLDTAPIQFYHLDTKFRSGNVAINNQGRVVGLMKNDGSLLPSIYITRILPQVLSNQVIIYPSLGVDGWFSEEAPIVVDKNSIAGFAVTKVWSANNKLRKGDVITEINGRVVTADNLWYIITSNSTLRLKIIRADKVLELETKQVDTSK